MPDVFRVSKTSCGFSKPDSNRIAYLYHKKDSPSVATVWLRGDTPELIPDLSESVPFQLRDKIKDNWSRAFPTFVNIPKDGSSTELAERLITYSLPFASKKPIAKASDAAINDILIVDGKSRAVLLTRYERNKSLRAKCLLHFGYRCQGCGLLMAERYGRIAKKLIHVHHIERLADIGEHVVDPAKDLVPLCPNCHSVVHLKTPPMSLTELQRLVGH